MRKRKVVSGNMNVMSSSLNQNRNSRFSVPVGARYCADDFIDNRSLSTLSKHHYLVGPKRDCFVSSTQENKNLRTALEVIPTFRRLDRVGDKISKSDNLPAIGLIGLAVLNAPEDLRDTKAGFNQITNVIKGKPADASYDYKKAQHPFSFFRGTLLHRFIDSDTTPFPRLAKFIADKDSTLYNTKLGKFVTDFFHIDKENVDTNIRNVYNRSEKIKALSFKSESKFGEITARALTRTTKIGSGILGVIESAHFVNEIKKGKKISDEIGQSAITYTSSLVGIGYGGAVGAKFFGPIGSIAGMGAGAVLANKISSHFDT